MKRCVCLSFIFLYSLLFGANEDLSNLLAKYKKESELSNITKKESAGYVDIFTRDDLEKMQAHNLWDVLKTVSGVFLQKDVDGGTFLSKPTIERISFSSVRLYINDHDMSSSTFNSAFLIWGDMPIEYIDHIEVYKAASSIEFGNETATLIIKLYTKLASREHGGKVRVMADERGGYDLSTYQAQQIKDSFSYFVFANTDNIKRDEYSNYYNGHEYKLKDDKKSYAFYGNFLVNDWLLEFGGYHKNNDNFIDRGVHHTSTDGDLGANQLYTHITKKFQNNIKLQLSYDNIDYDRTSKDPNGIKGANLPILDLSSLSFRDRICSVVLEKSLNIYDSRILLGGFYKIKKFQEIGHFDYMSSNGSTSVDFGNTLNLASLYFEDIYTYDSKTTFVASLKGDFYRYDKDVRDTDQAVFKVGGTRQVGDVLFKVFYTKTYRPLPFYKLYNPANVLLLANPNLKPSKGEIIAFSSKYKTAHNSLELQLAQQKAKDVISYSSKGYINTGKNVRYKRIQLSYKYTFDFDNKIVCDFFSGKHSPDVHQSPKYGINVRMFNKYKKFDFYNEVLFKPSYTYTYGSTDIDMDNSYEYSTSVKYHCTKDLSLGFKGDNIFNTGYKQAYKGLNFSIPVTEQKFWVNMEYLF